MTLLVLKVSAVLAVALAAAALGARRSAAWRHWVLASGTVGALLLPALALVVPVWPVIGAPAPASLEPPATATIVSIALTGPPQQRRAGHGRRPGNARRPAPVARSVRP